MPLSLSAAMSTATLGSHLVIAIADRVPDFDVRPSCRESSISDCLGQEQIARGKLAEEWPRFTAREKARCAADARYAGAPSYVGWLTCLQINADTRGVPAAIGAPRESTTTGAATAGETRSDAGNLPSRLGSPGRRHR
jgi:hypothetical protein